MVKIQPFFLILRIYAEADESSFQRANDIQIAAIEGACDDLTEFIMEECPIDQETGQLRDRETDALIRDNQPIIHPGRDPARPNLRWQPSIIALAQQKSNVRVYPVGLYSW